jgi:uncharacterized protein DUF3168
MSFEADLKAHLQGDATVSATVADRIFPSIVPEGEAMPSITYTHIIGQPENSLDGFTSGLTRYAMQIDCWALTYPAVLALALAVRDRLGTNASTISFVVNEFPLIDDFEPDTKRFRRALGCACWFKE